MTPDTTRAERESSHQLREDAIHVDMIRAGLCRARGLPPSHHYAYAQPVNEPTAARLVNEPDEAEGSEP